MLSEKLCPAEAGGSFLTEIVTISTIIRLLFGYMVRPPDTYL